MGESAGLARSTGTPHPGHANHGRNPGRVPRRGLRRWPTSAGMHHHRQRSGDFRISVINYRGVVSVHPADRLRGRVGAPFQQRSGIITPPQPGDQRRRRRRPPARHPQRRHDTRVRAALGGGGRILHRARHPTKVGDRAADQVRAWRWLTGQAPATIARLLSGIAAGAAERGMQIDRSAARRACPVLDAGIRAKAEAGSPRRGRGQVPPVTPAPLETMLGVPGHTGPSAVPRAADGRDRHFGGEAPAGLLSFGAFGVGPFLGPRPPGSVVHSSSALIPNRIDKSCRRIGACGGQAQHLGAR